jgi:hypothetical protein
MKTAMQELIDTMTDKKRRMQLSLDLGLFRKSAYSQLTRPAQIDAMGYAIELAQSMLEKEKEQIKDAYKQGTCHHGDGYTATEYYEETFNTNKK